MSVSKINHLLTDSCNILRKTVTKDSNRNAVDSWNTVYTNISYALYSHALYRQRIEQLYAKQIPTNIQRIGIFNAGVDIQSGDRIVDVDTGTTYYISGLIDSVSSRYGKTQSHLEAFLEMEPI